MNFKKAWELIRATFADWSEDKAPRLAAALSYYTIFSLAPLLVLVIAITGFIIGNNEAIRQEIIAQVQGMIGQQGADAVKTIIDNAAKPSNGILATVLSIVTLFIGATGLFGQLIDALNTIWEVEPKKGRGVMGLIKDRFLSFTMVLGICFLLMVSLVISAVLSVLNRYFVDLLPGGAGIIAQVLNLVISIGVVTLIFALIFKVLPDVDVKWGDVWIGALVTALLFTIGKSLISLYLSTSATSSAYGAAGSLIILLLWINYSAQILFLGAEFTQVYARDRGSVITPSKNARPLTDTDRSQQGLPRREKPIERVQEVMVPISGQPAIHPETPSAVSTRERIRYAPPNANSVVPVIAAGTLAGIYTVSRIIRRVFD